MKLLLKPTSGILILFTTIALMGLKNKDEKDNFFPTSNDTAKIQVAILLDVSNSMDGLIEQAKAQLWNMVNTLGKAQCSNNLAPKIELALYEYGRDSNPVAEGYVKQIHGFTTDLDALSKSLFSLTTFGGEEYCGHVMFTAIKDLDWDLSPNSYKVIFIAGNEDFLQGDIKYTKACNEARKKGIIVNTIYCGNKADGIKEHWNLMGECGNGSYSNINSDAKIEDIATPYDSAIFALNTKLNSTYIPYGSTGAIYQEQQASVDKMNYTMNKSVATKRISVKAKAGLYKNSGWDIVDAFKDDKSIVEKVDKKTLPKELQNKNSEELKEYINKKNNERLQVQNEIAALNEKREKYIATERTKSTSSAPTLESEVEKAIKKQAIRFNMKIE